MFYIMKNHYFKSDIMDFYITDINDTSIFNFLCNEIEITYNIKLQCPFVCLYSVPPSFYTTV